VREGGQRREREREREGGGEGEREREREKRERARETESNTAVCLDDARVCVCACVRACVCVCVYTCSRMRATCVREAGGERKRGYGGMQSARQLVNILKSQCTHTCTVSSNLGECFTEFAPEARAAY